MERDRLGGVMGVARPLGEVMQEEQGHQVLTDTLPNINTTEDWAAAFGFAGQQSRDHDLLQQKIQQRDVNKLPSFTGFGALGPHETAFGKGR